MEFNSELYMVMGLINTTEGELEKKGYLSKKSEQGWVLNCEDGCFDINPYTVCKNTGIQIRGTFLYAYDLITYNETLDRKECMGVIEWDDYNKCYAVTTNALSRAKRSICKCNNIKVIGNVLLSEDDERKFDNYSEQEFYCAEKDVEPECRSKQYLNKRAEMFLPR